MIDFYMYANPAYIDLVKVAVHSFNKHMTNSRIYVVCDELYFETMDKALKDYCSVLQAPHINTLDINGLSKEFDMNCLVQKLSVMQHYSKDDTFSFFVDADVLFLRDFSKDLQEYCDKYKDKIFIGVKDPVALPQSSSYINAFKYINTGFTGFKQVPKNIVESFITWAKDGSNRIALLYPEQGFIASTYGNRNKIGYLPFYMNTIINKIANVDDGTTPAMVHFVSKKPGCETSFRQLRVLPTWSAPLLICSKYHELWLNEAKECGYEF